MLNARPARSGFSSLSSAAFGYNVETWIRFGKPAKSAKFPRGLQVERHSSHLQKPFPAEPATRWSPRLKRYLKTRSHAMVCQTSTVQYSSIYSSSQIYTNLHIRPNYELLARLYERWSAATKCFSCNPTAPAKDRCCPHAITHTNLTRDCSTNKLDSTPKWVYVSNYKYFYCANRKENWWKKCRLKGIVLQSCLVKNMIKTLTFNFHAVCWHSWSRI